MKKFIMLLALMSCFLGVSVEAMMSVGRQIVRRAQQAGRIVQPSRQAPRYQIKALGRTFSSGSRQESGSWNNFFSRVRFSKNSLYCAAFASLQLINSKKAQAAELPFSGYLDNGNGCKLLINNPSPVRSFKLPLAEAGGAIVIVAEDGSSVAVVSDDMDHLSENLLYTFDVLMKHTDKKYMIYVVSNRFGYSMEKDSALGAIKKGSVLSAKVVVAVIKSSFRERMILWDPDASIIENLENLTCFCVSSVDVELENCILQIDEDKNSGTYLGLYASQPGIKNGYTQVEVDCCNY